MAVRIKLGVGYRLAASAATAHEVALIEMN